MCEFKHYYESRHNRAAIAAVRCRAVPPLRDSEIFPAIRRGGTQELLSHHRLGLGFVALA